MLLLFFMEWTKVNCYFLYDEYHQITQWCLEVTHTSYWRSEPWKRMFGICGCLPMAAQCYLPYEWGVENLKTNALHSRQVKSANGQLLERQQKPVIVFLALLVKHKVSRKILKQEVCRYIYAKVYFDSSSFLPDDLFSKKVSSRSLSAVNQMVIPRPRSELRRHSLWYRRPVV